jgi:hypothetical protein
MIEDADEKDDKKCQKWLKQIQNAHVKQQHYSRIRSIIKPQQKGGLSYVLVPKDFLPDDYQYESDEVNDWEPIHDPKELQEFVQKRNIMHFRQAHETPFTLTPLADQIPWDADSISANEIMNGAKPLELITGDEYTQKILTYIANQAHLPEIDTHMTLEQVSQGFKKWKEETSTLPSGCHLRL